MLRTASLRPRAEARNKLDLSKTSTYYSTAPTLKSRPGQTRQLARSGRDRLVLGIAATGCIRRFGRAAS
jgi:hypothetical protein